MRKKLQKLFLLCAFFGMLTGHLGAFGVQQVWTYGDIVTDWDLVSPSGKYSTFDDDLQMDSTITISQDVYIIAYRRDVTVTMTDDVIIIPAADASTSNDENKHAWGHLIFFAGGESELGAGVRRTITVEVTHDLTFQGVWTYSTDLIVTFSGQGQVIFKLRDDKQTPNYATGGQQSAGLSRGVIVSFTRGYDDNEGNFEGLPGGDITRGGTRVYILMDQTKTQAMDDGNNKVIFQRVSYNGTEVAAAYPYRGYHTGVVVGPSSFITYLSTNATGRSDDPYLDGSYGSLAFDPTHAGKGRMYLRIAGDPKSQIIGVPYRVNGRYNFHDGGVVVCGHFVPTFYTEADIRLYAYLNATAGRRAIFRIIDDLRYAAQTTDDPEVADRRGLLVINENTTVPCLAGDPYLWFWFEDDWYGGSDTYPPLASHPNAPDYWANDYAWFKAPVNQYTDYIWPADTYGVDPTFPNPKAFNVRTGFVLGTNGWMDIYHRTFLDHVACNYGELNYFVVQDYVTWLLMGAQLYTYWNNGSEYFKFRNPAAFVVDGLNFWQNRNEFIGGGEEGFVYNHPSGTDYAYDPTLNAHMIFYGDGRAYFRCACEKSLLEEGYGVVGYFRGGYGPFETDGYMEYQFYVDYGNYDSNYVPGNWNSITPGQGEGVLDIEGPFSVYGKARNDAPNRSGYVAAVGEEKGVIGMPTVELDYKGEESNLQVDEIADRPLVLGKTYYITNSPHILSNSIWDLYDVIIRHTDVTKLMTTDPAFAPPAIVGGEAKYLNDRAQSYVPDYLFEWFEYPKIRLHGSELNMHESLVASGVRFVVKERWLITSEGARTPVHAPPADQDAGNHLLVYGDDANNTSIFRFYDHGDQLDTLLHGYGRMFMLGTGMNQASYYNETLYGGVPGREVWTNDTYASGFINVYRGRLVDPPDLPAETIRLSIRAQDDSEGQDTGNALRAPLQITSPEDEDNRAHHLFLLSRGDAATQCCPCGYGTCYMSLGWTPTVGSDYFFPWEAHAVIFGIGSYLFDIDTDTVTPATVSVDGNFIYFGGTNWRGEKAVVPVTSSTQGSIIYANHGGRVTITQPQSTSYDPNQHGYDMYVDTVLAYRLWGSEPLCGIIDVPKDQVIYGHGFGRQPYDININLSREHIEDARYGLRIRTYNTTGVVDPDRASAATGTYSRWHRQDLHSGEEVVLPWGRNSQTYNTYFIPSKTLPTRNRMLTRYTANINTPPAFPQNMLFFTTGDYVTQLKVSGATMADPLNLLVTGNNGAPGAARIREIVSIPTNPIVQGEGAHALIFLNHSGRIGLGSRDFNEHSDNAWNLLGKDYVTICADGDGIVDVNSNLLVTDNGAIVATTLFGADITEYGLADDTPRLTFFSEQPHEIRVPKGVELDLGTFAQQLGTDPQQQIIKFGGALRLIFEPGSTLRFPHIDTVTPLEEGEVRRPRPVLYMSDDTELIFEGDLEESKGRHLDIRSTESAKTLIIGHGEIWLNKNAKMIVNDEAMVRVGSDPRNKSTDLKISLQRQGQFVIGTEQVAGGSFEVGNPVDMDTYYEETGYDHPINFELVINGPKARFHIDREGYLGFGVGIVNKVPRQLINQGALVSQNPDTLGAWNPGSDAWQVQALHNVHKITVIVIQGFFDHSNIFDGNDRRASLMAVGPVYAYEEVEGEGAVDGSYTFQVTDFFRANVLGGGNIMMLQPLGETYPGKALVNIWNYADVYTAPRPDGTVYNVLASSRIILQRTDDLLTRSVVTAVGNAGRNFTKDFTVTGANTSDFFSYISYPGYLAVTPTKYVSIGATEFRDSIAFTHTVFKDATLSSIFTTGAEIFRLDGFNMKSGDKPEEALEIGVLIAQGLNEPLRYSVPREQ